MASKNRPGHGERKAAAKTLKQKRAEKRAKRADHQAKGNPSFEKTFEHSR